MNTKVKGIILNTKEYKEADKVADIFTVEYGSISVKFTSVKKEKAKFKNVCQPFVLCELELNENNGFFTVTNASVIDNNFGITQNYEKNIIAYSIFEIVLKFLPKQQQELQIFALVLQYLDKLEASDNSFAVFIDFIKAFLNEEGEGMQVLQSNLILLDKSTGNFVSSPNEFTVNVDKKIYSVLIEPYNEDKVEKLKTACKLLLLCLKIKYDIEIKSFLMI